MQPKTRLASLRAEMKAMLDHSIGSAQRLIQFTANVFPLQTLLLPTQIQTLRSKN